MKARAVIGANFGDEGKGLMVDYLCATEGAGMVVRYNGGAQAGHTVVTPDGKRHVFRHFGSGTLCGVPTYLSNFFIINPIIALREGGALGDLGIKPTLYVHPNCQVSTFADMMINQRRENARGGKRHGSVGVGIHETMQRLQVDELSITMSDLWNGVDLRDRLKDISGRWAEFRTGSPLENADEMIESFIEECDVFAGLVHPLGIDRCEDPIFEGAQGLLLDQDNAPFFPHVTHSKTGMHNIRVLCDQAGFTCDHPYYVTRTYLTRHGAGRLPGEDHSMSFADDTNLRHPYQGDLRFAPLDMGMLDRCNNDSLRGGFKLVVTHCDQLAPPAWLRKMGCHFSTGPTRDDVAIGTPTEKASA